MGRKSKRVKPHRHIPGQVPLFPAKNPHTGRWLPAIPPDPPKGDTHRDRN
jgi:hypothetical protein